MDESYAMEESMGFLIEYMQGFMPVSRQVWDVEEEEGVNGEVFEVAGQSINLGQILWDIAHHYVLTHTTTMVTWVRY
jgi:hypothetical protein